MSVNIKNFLQNINKNNNKTKIKIDNYLKNGCQPWSEGYHDFKWNFIKKILKDDSILNQFKNNELLPQGYGQFLDERVIEYPWLLSKLDTSSAICLDAGSTINHHSIVTHPYLESKKLFILTLAPENKCYWKKGISYLYQDLRNTILKDNSFDMIFCISTLEHIGMDNTVYNAPEYKEYSKYDFLQALKEIHRILKPRGKCFISVPYGIYQYDGFQQQFDSEMIELIINQFCPHFSKETYYKYSRDGWNISTKELCKDCIYFNFFKTKYFNSKSNLDYDSDLAAAARAVALLEMVK